MARDRAGLEAGILGLLDAGDLRGAATAALEGYGPEILGVLVSVIGDETAGGEVFADFCEDLWKGMAGFARRSSFRTWAYRIAWNAARMHWRDPYRRRARRLATDADECSQLAERLRASSLRLDSVSPADRLARLRGTLDPEERTLLVLRVDKELSWKEIADVFGDGADPAALRKRFERLKSRLMRMAQAEGILAPRTR